MLAAQHQATTEQPAGINENGLQEYGWMTHLLMVFHLTCLNSLLRNMNLVV
jgi:hypothetical protein